MGQHLSIGCRFRLVLAYIKVWLIGLDEALIARNELKNRQG